MVLTSGGVINGGVQIGHQRFPRDRLRILPEQRSRCARKLLSTARRSQIFHRYQYGGLRSADPSRRIRSSSSVTSKGLNQLLGLSERSLTISNSARTGVVSESQTGRETITVAITPAIQPFLPLFPGRKTETEQWRRHGVFTTSPAPRQARSITAGRKGRLSTSLPRPSFSTSYQWDNLIACGSGRLQISSWSDSPGQS